MPLAEEKMEGPYTTLVFLGIEIDTIRMQVQMPTDKLSRVKSIVSLWLQHRKASKKREMHPMACLLQYACKVVRPDRSLIRQIFETMETVKHCDHWARLNTSFRADLVW